MVVWIYFQWNIILKSKLIRLWFGESNWSISLKFLVTEQTTGTMGKEW